MYVCMYVYIYIDIIYIYTNFPVNAIVRLPHPRSGELGFLRLNNGLAAGEGVLDLTPTIILPILLTPKSFGRKFNPSSTRS